MIRVLLALAMLVQLLLPRGGADMGLLTFRWSSAEPRVSTENSSGSIAASSNLRCVATRPQVPRPTAQLVAAYGFEDIHGDKTPDSSGESHPATLVNTVLSTGRFGKGIALNGTNAYLRID